MATPRTIKLVETLTWRLIYGGMFIVVMALVMDAAGQGLNWLIFIGGLALTFAGAVLVYVRSRLTEDS